jgi:hypothetical protein
MEGVDFLFGGPIWRCLPYSSEANRLRASYEPAPARLVRPLGSCARARVRAACVLGLRHHPVLTKRTAENVALDTY